MADPGFAGIAVVLLAAGRGARFGEAKLGADLGGRPLALHAAAMLAGLPFARHLAVVRDDTPDLAPLGWTVLPLDPPHAPQSRSLAIGVAAARAAGARGMLIALADMPLVPAGHVAALVAAFDGDRITSSAGGQHMPPALFGAMHFDALEALSGDRGAGALLAGAPCLPLPPGTELDVDRPEDLARAAGLLRSGLL